MPNDLLEHVCRYRLKGQARQVLDAVVALTWRYHDQDSPTGRREWAEISISQLARMTDINTSRVCECLGELVDKRVLLRRENGQQVSYAVNRQYHQWARPPRKDTTPRDTKGGTWVGRLYVPAEHWRLALELFEWWNGQGIIVHSSPNKSAGALSRLLASGAYDMDSVWQGVRNYVTVVKDPECFYDSRKPLFQLLQPDELDRFMTHNRPFDIFRKRKPKQAGPRRSDAPRGVDGTELM